MKFEIKQGLTKKVLFSIEVKTFKLAVIAAVLSEADLSWADLSGADLSGVNLSGADLPWVDLSDANLSGVDLSGANLSGTDLSWANLSRANLSRANLSWANLSWADLSRANLSSANLDYSTGFRFHCSFFDIKADLRLAAQLAYHFCRMDFSDEMAKKAQRDLRPLANRFHRIGINVDNID